MVSRKSLRWVQHTRLLILWSQVYIPSSESAHNIRAAKSCTLCMPLSSPLYQIYIFVLICQCTVGYRTLIFSITSPQCTVQMFMYCVYPEPLPQQAVSRVSSVCFYLTLGMTCVLIPTHVLILHLHFCSFQFAQFLTHPDTHSVSPKNRRHCVRHEPVPSTSIL